MNKGSIYKFIGNSSKPFVRNEWQSTQVNKTGVLFAPKPKREEEGREWSSRPKARSCVRGPPDS